MSISLSEEFTGYDWQEVSRRVGQLVPVVCIITAFLASWFDTYEFGVSVLTVVIGLITGIWEMPEVYMCVPMIGESVKPVLLERFKLKLHVVRAALYFLAAYTILMGGTFCVCAGGYIAVSGLLYIFAYINRRSDASDGIEETDTGEDDEADNEARTNMLSSRFGTF